MARPWVVTQGLRQDLVVLRSKVFHDWIENTLEVDEPRDMAGRWRQGAAMERLRTSATYLEDADRLARSLGAFSSSSLIEFLPAFSSLDAAARAQIRSRLDEIYASQVGLPELMAEYANALGQLRTALKSFTDTLGRGPTEEEVLADWARVRDHAEMFKRVVARVPRGVLLP